MTDKRVGFLEWVLGADVGFLAIGYKNANTGAWVETFFRWPNEKQEVQDWIDQRVLMGNLYFCPTLLRKAKRTKSNITTSRICWADLDECPPESLLLQPSVVVQTSDSKYQAFWMLNRHYDALDVQSINKAIAYRHADEGCDKSGWDLTQYLRIPGTKNHKYLPALQDIFVVSADTSLTYTPNDFEIYLTDANHPETKPSDVPPVPDIAALDAQEILNRAAASASGRAWNLFALPPTTDSWSESVWELELVLFNSGLSKEEVFAVVREAACNKWRRDANTDEEADDRLWKEIIRAETTAQQAAEHYIEPDHEEAFYVPDKPLVTEAERETCKQRITLVEEYINWAKTIGDAAVQYHEAGAFIILSSLLCGSVRLPTSYGSVVPNLWFMILADTTLTRKTTAMDLAMDIIAEIDSDAILATDGSIEGLMTSLSMRPGRPSVFLRDEFSGLLELVSKRDYYAGMLETLTKLYDGKLQKRILRKETITVRDPRLILFAGGIKERIYALLTQDHINSGFAPRFCFITAESDPTRVKPLGPPTERTLEGRERLLERLRDLYNHYSAPPVNTNGTDPDVVDFGSVIHNAVLTPGAWRRYNRIEDLMTEIGLRSSVDYLLTPMLARLCQSGLKAAILLAASERLHFDEVVVEEWHIVQAFYYVERWKTHALNVIANAGKTSTEKELEKIYDYISEYPGVSRGKIMQRHGLTARTADNVFSTLLQRGLVRIEKVKGKQENYYPVRSSKAAKVEDNVKLN